MRLKNRIMLKTSLDVARIRKACRIVEDLLVSLNTLIVPGVTTSWIDSYCGDFISSRKGIPALKGYRGFPANVCISVNNVAAHGIGCDYRLQDGDIVTVDTTIEAEGWFGDGAWTYIAGSRSSSAKRLLKAAWKAMLAGVGEATAGKRLGDIGYAINRTAARYGCSVIEELAGHGIGKNIHEEPVILNTGSRGTGLPVVPGMVFTIEPILSLGSKDISLHSDGWSIITGDSSITAQFECTVAVFSEHTDILTLEGINLQKYIDFPPMF